MHLFDFAAYEFNKDLPALKLENNEVLIDYVIAALLTLTNKDGNRNTAIFSWCLRRPMMRGKVYENDFKNLMPWNRNGRHRRRWYSGNPDSV